MRIAFISDIHGHLAGLEIILKDIEQHNCSRIVCLGDLVEGGENDRAVIDLIRQLAITCVRGNHDEQNDLSLPSPYQEFLTSLPPHLEEEDRLYCHISPRWKRLKIRNGIEAWNVFDEAKARLIFTGHQHRPIIYGERSEEFGQAHSHEFEYNEAFHFDKDDRYIICVGSAAYGRDHIGELRYAILDTEQDSIEHRRVPGPCLPRDYTHKS